MLAIHGVWSDGRLHVWAEDTGRLGLQSEPRAGASSRLARPHPFTASPGLLTDALAEFGEQAADLARKATETDLVLWLPATPGRPMTSPDAAAADAAVASTTAAGAPEASAIVASATVANATVASLPEPVDEATDDIQVRNGRVPATVASTRRPGGLALRPWQIPALSLDPAAALALLTAIGQPGARSE